ncbi:hypothetical protein P7K49_010547 [Saguinus oedipus]|uniref:Uncharacterized protein n=1 Tax=Saguinus oedipus TaxID=9490 RepID=A0ABQ9VN46_SAGOE|nr:hypothetical protein P7K49_010547 [Saguinus oedipus]
MPLIFSVWVYFKPEVSRATLLPSLSHLMDEEVMGIDYNDSCVIFGAILKPKFQKQQQQQQQQQHMHWMNFRSWCKCPDSMEALMSEARCPVLESIIHSQPGPVSCHSACPLPGTRNIPASMGTCGWFSEDILSSSGKGIMQFLSGHLVNCLQKVQQLEQENEK